MKTPHSKLLLLLSLYIFSAQAQNANTNLWSVTGPGIKNSYLYITGPSCESQLKVSPGLKNALAEVKAIAVEYDLYSPDAKKLAAFNVAKEESETIKGSLSANEYTQFVDVLKEHGYPEQAIPRLSVYKVQAAYMMLTSLNGPCGTTGRPLIYEKQFKTIADQNKLQFMELQNIDGVIEEMKAHSSNYWKDNISYALANQAQLKTGLQREADLYKVQDLKNIEKLYSGDNVYKLQFKDNVQKSHADYLVSAIGKQAAETPTLFTISISNMAVPNASVFQLLTAKGYKVTPVLP